MSKPLIIYFHDEKKMTSEKESEFLSTIKNLCKHNSIGVRNIDEFNTQINYLSENTEIYIFIHFMGDYMAKNTDKDSPAKTWATSLEDDEGKKWEYFVVTSNTDKTNETIFDDKKQIYNLNDLYREIFISKNPKYQPQKIKSNNRVSIPPKVDYAIITALYDEFVSIEKLFDWQESFRTETKEFKIGLFNTDKSIKVVAAIPPKTGMVDSAIISTQMLELFKPKYLLMSGVCGSRSPKIDVSGLPDIKLGDIVVASSVFTFQKGKISDIKDEEGKPIELYDSPDIEKREKLDLSHIYDSNGKNVEINIENFEKEIESETLNTLTEDDLVPNLLKIALKLNEDIKRPSEKINIHFEPIACSTMVINKKEYFDKRIKVAHRKTAAVEMEGYGVARACKFANNGKTKFLIFKSVMDNTVAKVDDFKEQAAHNSARFLKYLLELNVLK